MKLRSLSPQDISARIKRGGEISPAVLTLTHCEAIQVEVESMKGKIEKAIQAEWKIAIYRQVIQDPVVEKFLTLLKELQRTVPVPAQALTAYYDFATAFLPLGAELAVPGRSAWQNYLLEQILFADNLFSRQAERYSWEQIPPPVKAMVQRDLEQLAAIGGITDSYLQKVFAERMGDCADTEGLPSWEGLYLQDSSSRADDDKTRLALLFQEGNNWEETARALCSYYRAHGVGIFGRHLAFRWVKRNGEGSLVGVKNPDTVKINQLYEYEREQARIIQNTEQFLAGYPANNVLLYGDRGTGKSSTVKALVNLYGEKGLRLVEVQKQDLDDFPAIISLLAVRPQRFIIFVDDLSFNEDEGEYRELKALLEGGIEARPDNVLVYATSNRRHLIKESFADRKITGYDPDDEDVRYMDTLQEKLSLADRFGITVTFAAPDQKKYLAIVEKMARERGLAIEKEELFQLALKWEISYNSRSGRTARQFIDFLEGQLGMQNRISGIFPRR